MYTLYITPHITTPTHTTTPTLLTLHHPPPSPTHTHPHTPLNPPFRSCKAKSLASRQSWVLMTLLLSYKRSSKCTAASSGALCVVKTARIRSSPSATTCFARVVSSAIWIPGIASVLGVILRLGRGMSRVFTFHEEYDEFSCTVHKSMYLLWENLLFVGGFSFHKSMYFS